MSNSLKKSWLPEAIVIGIALVFAVIGCLKAVTATTTTIGSNIVTSGIVYATSTVVDGAMTLKNGEYIDNANDGYISLMGIASTSSIYFGTNAEYIDNANNGYISFMGIASTTSIYFGTYGATIDNRVNGVISLMGIASTSSIYFGTNAEYIDNAHNGYISLMGIASTTSLYFGTNAEYIDNANNGYISLMGIASTTSLYFGTNAATITNPSSGIVTVGASLNTGGYATSTVDGVFQPGKFPTSTTIPSCNLALKGGIVYYATSTDIGGWLCVCNGAAWKAATSTLNSCY